MVYLKHNWFGLERRNKKKLPSREHWVALPLQKRPRTPYVRQRKLMGLSAQRSPTKANLNTIAKFVFKPQNWEATGGNRDVRFS